MCSHRCTHIATHLVTNTQFLHTSLLSEEKKVSLCIFMGLVAQIVKNLPSMQETRVQSLDWKDPLEKKMATHSSILAWEIPWMEESGRLKSMGSQRVGHD